MTVDVREHRHGGALLQPGVLERQGTRPVHPGVRIGRHRGAVREAGGDVGAGRGQRQVDGLGGGAHGEEESALLHEAGNSLRDRTLLGRHRWKAELAGHRLVSIHHLGEPRSTGVVEHELRILPGEILVVQVQPVVIREPALNHFGIPDLLVLHPGIFQRHGHRVVPGRRVGRRVYGHPGRLLQRHRVHVGLLDLGPDAGHPASVGVLHRDAGKRRVAHRRGITWKQE